MLNVLVPHSYSHERKYIIELMLGEFLGLEIRIQPGDRDNTQITLDDDDGRLIIADGLFRAPSTDWLQPGSLPELPLRVWEPSADLVPDQLARYKLPILYGDPQLRDGATSENHREISLSIDVFGSAFFLLTRYEEMVSAERDQRERFAATASLAFQQGWLHRPLVNEYLEVLWRAIQQLWPGLKRRSRSYRALISHDVDVPLWLTGRRLWGVTRSCLVDAVVRRDVGLAVRKQAAYWQSRRGQHDGDPCNTFDFIMEQSEQHGLRNAFYFIAGHTGGRIDGNYTLDDSWIRSLLRKIHERGHEIGLHPSYNTLRDATALQQEFATLRRVMAEEKIEQPEWGGRQHFLRWQNPTTWQIWQDAGLDYDSTLSFADHAGFRCGTCYEFPVFNLETRELLTLKERPLVVMEGSLFDYMGLSWSQAFEQICNLNETCRRFNGDFTLLWHNSQIVSRLQQRQYREVIEMLTTKS